MPAHNLAPPGSANPVYMLPLEAVVKMRTTYQTEQPASVTQVEPTRRHVKGQRRYKHIVLDEDTESYPG
jgi:hypothetical protein